MDGSPEGELALLVLLVLIAAFFSGTEAAYLALSRTRLRQMGEQRLFGSALLQLQQRHRPLVLTVLLLGITMSNYTAERVATLFSVRYLGTQAGPFVAIVIMTVVIIVFGEVIPIQVGANSSERVSRWGAVVVTPVAAVLLPLVLLLSLISRLVLYVVGIRTPGSLLPGVSEEHLKAMIEQSEEQGVLEAGERRMLHGVLDFGDRTTAQLMTPRPDMICVADDQPLAEALQLGLEHHHSRLPVFEGNSDNIIGILHLKDLLPRLVSGRMDCPAREIARPAYYVPEGLPADALLRELQRKRHMLAVVKDEWGGTAGIVTVEDVLEEIVGDIVDEYDVEEPEIVCTGTNELLCDARVGLHELQEYVDRELPTDEYDSLGGLVLGLAGHIPAVGESFDWHELHLVVRSVSGPRLEKVLVVAPPRPHWQPQDEADNE